MGIHGVWKCSHHCHESGWNHVIGDVSEGDLWFFPAGFPHSIQGLGPDGCQFLLVFNEGMFSEDNTFLLSEFVAHVPPDVLSKNSRLSPSDIAKLPKEQLYIFPSNLPQSLAADRASIGGGSVQAPQQYTFKMGSMAPTVKSAGGEVRIVDSENFPISTTIAADWSVSSRERCASCTGTPMLRNGSSGWLERAA
jgi:oxalate decarboxylase